jgi:hypothetical protein
MYNNADVMKAGWLLNAVFPLPPFIMPGTPWMRLGVTQGHGEQHYKCRCHTADSVLRKVGKVCTDNAVVSVDPVLYHSSGATDDADLVGDWGSWCVWCKHELTHGEQMSQHLLQMQSDPLDVSIVRSGCVVQGIVLLHSFCDDMYTLRKANRLLQRRYADTATSEWWTNTNGNRHKDTWGKQKRMIMLPNGDDGDLVKLSTQRYDIDEVIALLKDNDKTERKVQWSVCPR